MGAAPKPNGNGRGANGRFLPGNAAAVGAQHPGARHALARRASLDAALSPRLVAEAVATVAAIMRDEAAPHGVRVRAAAELLARACGPVEAEAVVLRLEELEAELGVNYAG